MDHILGWNSFAPFSFLTTAQCVALAVLLGLSYLIWKIIEGDGVPEIHVETSHMTKAKYTVENNYICVPRKVPAQDGRIHCYDPATMEFLGFVPVLGPEDVKEHICSAREAQRVWALSPFSQRRRLLQTLQKYIVSNQDVICRVTARDTGKALVDASFGEIMAACELISWLLREGERWLRTEYRSAATVMPHKVARVEYQPLGVVAAIVPWNYPFYNVLNQVLPAVFAGNGVVVKLLAPGVGARQLVVHVLP